MIPNTTGIYVDETCMLVEYRENMINNISHSPGINNRICI